MIFGVDKKEVSIRSSEKELSDIIDKILYEAHTAQHHVDFKELFSANYKMAELKGGIVSAQDVLGQTVHMIAPTMIYSGINGDIEKSPIVDYKRSTYLFRKKDSRFEKNDRFEILVPDVISIQNQHGTKGSLYRFISVWEGAMGEEMKELPDRFVHYDKKHLKDYTKEGIDKMIAYCEEYSFVPQLKELSDKNPIKNTGEVEDAIRYDNKWEIPDDDKDLE